MIDFRLSTQFLQVCAPSVSGASTGVSTPAFSKQSTLKRITLMKSTKSLWAAGLAALAILFAIPSMASADNCRNQGRCSRCGGGVYANYVVVGYDRCGHPIYSWVPVAHSCQVRHYAPRPVYPSRGYTSNDGCRNGSRSGYGYGYGGNYYGGRPCPPSRGGFSINFGF
jgi:hypothetical protein